MSGGTATLYHGDALDVLREMEDDSIDAMVTDPPAGIKFMGVGWDSFSGEPDGRRGKDRSATFDRVGGNHNPSDPQDAVRTKRVEGQRFREAMRVVFAECLRVLKPGAHGLVWALPRTSHWTAIALEDAGFEIRDVVTHHYGTGFPKSRDVSNALDQEAGEEPVERPHPTNNCPGGRWCECATKGSHYWETKHPPAYEPATEEARQWKGWGTALKPASEHWILVRKPLSESTVAGNVLEHGTGAVNVDGCRIGTEVETWPATRSGGGGYMMKHRPEGKGGTEQTGDAPPGRWPSNLILSHHPSCELIGVKRVRGSRGVRGRGGDVYAGGDGFANTLSEVGQEVGYTDEDGLETVPDFECHRECPVAMMDAQSGDVGGGSVAPFERVTDEYYSGGWPDSHGHSGYDPPGAGGASRFFYVAKASRSERNIGGVDNTHPTVKPVELMQYLCRMVTPRGGVVLDPFMGSGSTGLGALREGFDFIGCEREGTYMVFAERRIRGDAPLLNELEVRMNCTCCEWVGETLGFFECPECGACFACGEPALTSLDHRDDCPERGSGGSDNDGSG